MRYICPICGKETSESDEVFGEIIPDDGTPVVFPCADCINHSFRAGWGLTLCNAQWVARQNRWPELTGATSQDELDQAIVLRDAEVRELQTRLQDLAISPAGREIIIKKFIDTHSDAAFWLTAEYPAAELIHSLGG